LITTIILYLLGAALSYVEKQEEKEQPLFDKEQTKCPEYWGTCASSASWPVTFVFEVIKDYGIPAIKKLITRR